MRIELLDVLRLSFLRAKARGSLDGIRTKTAQFDGYSLPLQLENTMINHTASICIGLGGRFGGRQSRVV